MRSRAVVQVTLLTLAAHSPLATRCAFCDKAPVMGCRAAVVLLVVLGCRKPAPAGVHGAPPPVAAGLLAAAAPPPPENVGKTMLSRGALSISVESTAQALPSYLTGLRVETVSAAD